MRFPPGMLHAIINGAPPGAHVVVASVCMQPDTIEPAPAIHKQLRLDFVPGYSSREFATRLADITEGRIDAAAVVNEATGLAEIPGACKLLSRNQELVKVTVDSTR